MLTNLRRAVLALSHKQVTERLKRNLLAEEQAHQAFQRRALKRQQLEAQLAQADALLDAGAAKSLNRQLAALLAADGRYQTTRVERRKSITQNQQQIVEIQVQIEGTKAKPRNRAWKPSARPRGSNSTANASAGWTS